jgi:chromosome segregation ATPase
MKEFYGSPSDASVAHQSDAQATTSTPNAETGSATSPPETVAPAAEVKSDAPKEAETEKASHEDGHRQAARRLGKQVRDLETTMAQLAEENKVLKARLDGTYEEPQGPTPEQIQARAMFEGREIASRELASQRYGEEKVHERIYSKDSELNQLRGAHPWIDARIATSQQPTLEAWNILEEHAFKSKYGNDPSEWKAKILAELKPVIIEEFKKTLHASPTGAPAPSVTQARGDGGPSQQPKTLAQLMYGTPART